MGAWGTGIFSDDLAIEVRDEYNTLLSVGNSYLDAEKMIIDHYLKVLANDKSDTEVFWFALALTEWKKGHLSDTVKKEAIRSIKSGRDLERWMSAGNAKKYNTRKKVLEQLYEQLLLPMPEERKPKMLSSRFCPWTVGSLLAYRIVSNEILRDTSCYKKYVLLRVVKVERHPASHIFDTGIFDESMMVGLYNWMGDSVPNEDEISKLSLIPIEEDIKPLQKQSRLQSLIKPNRFAWLVVCNI